MRGHDFKVSVQQQGNWTSVFVDIKSPDQVLAQQNPGQDKMAPSELQKTNMFSQITDEKKKLKLASRGILFEGEQLKTPSKIFNDVAGVLDLDAAIGKIMYYLAKVKPELIPEITSLLSENVFKRREQWNLPPEQQDEYKKAISGRIDPDEPTVMKFTFAVPKGKAEQIVQKISAMSADITASHASQREMQEMVERAIKQATPMTSTGQVEVGAVTPLSAASPEVRKELNAGSAIAAPSAA